MLPKANKDSASSFKTDAASTPGTVLSLICTWFYAVIIFKLVTDCWQANQAMDSLRLLYLYIHMQIIQMPWILSGKGQAVSNDLPGNGCSEPKLAVSKVLNIKAHLKPMPFGFEQ